MQRLPSWLRSCADFVRFAGMGTALAMAFATGSMAQLPVARLYSVFPPGGRQGTTVEVTVSGADLEGAGRLHFTHAGIQAVQKTQQVEGKDTPQPVANVFVVTIAGDVAPGAYDVHASGTYGVSNPRSFVVSDLAEVIETEPNNTPSQGQEISLPTVVNGRSDGGADLDFYKVKLSAGQRLIVDCAAQQIDSRMDASLALFDLSGRELAFSDNFDHRDPLLDFTAPSDDVYLLQVRDHLYSGNAEYVYRLRLTGTYIDFVLPPVVQPGAKQDVTVYGRGLPGGSPAEGVEVEGRPLEKLTVSLEAPADATAAQRLASSRWVQPEDSSLDGFDYRLKTEAGSTNAAAIYYGAAPTVVEVEANNEPDKAQVLAVPCEFVGQFQSRRDDDWVAFDVKKGDIYWIELFAQRLGSPADPQILVQLVTTDEKGAEKVSELTVQDDSGANIGGLAYNTASDDPGPYRLNASADGRCRIRVRDLARDVRGDARFLYRLSIRSPLPEFRVVAVPVNPVPPEGNDPNPWTLHVRKGGAAKLEVNVFRTEGFAGPVEVSVEGLPEKVQCAGAVIAPGQNGAPLVFTATEDAPDGVSELRLVAKATLGDQEVTREVRSGTIVWGVQQGQAAISRMARGLYLSVGQPAPLFVEAKRGPRITVAQGHELYLPVAITRRGDFAGPVALTGARLPGNLQNENVNVPAEQKEGVVHLFVNNNAPEGTHTFYLQATAQVPFTKDPEGKNKQNVNVVEPSTPVVLTIVKSPLLLQPMPPNNGQVKRGEKLAIPVKVTRRGDFKGSVTLELLLPPGVSGVKAEPVTVATDQAEATLTVEAAADATAGNHPFVNVRAKVDLAGQALEVDQTIPLNVQ